MVPELKWTLNSGKKVQSTYGSGAGVDPPHELSWDIVGTEARDRLDAKLRSKIYSQNMDLELDLELTLHMSYGET